MVGEFNWLSWKTKKQRKKEEAAYYSRSFPYGEPQRLKIAELLKELFPEEDESAAMIAYLTCKEVFTDARENDSESETQLALKVMKKYLKRYKMIVKPDDLATYTSLVLADCKITEALEYPTADEIRAAAETVFDSI